MADDIAFLIQMLREASADLLGSIRLRSLSRIWNRSRKFKALITAYRRLVETMAAQFPVGAELSVTVFRENDPEGKQACAFYKALGFTEGGETTVFGRPCRRLMLTVSQNPAGSGCK